MSYGKIATDVMVEYLHLNHRRQTAVVTLRLVSPIPEGLCGAVRLIDRYQEGLALAAPILEAGVQHQEVTLRLLNHFDNDAFFGRGTRIAFVHLFDPNGATLAAVEVPRKPPGNNRAGSLRSPDDYHVESRSG